MQKNKNARIPVVMYHSVGVVNPKWHWNYLTCPVDKFESQLKWLKKAGYYTVNFQEIFDYINNGKPLPKKSIFLTFDDGYLDNYVFAYPLLKKYGMKGTIFANPDFVDKRNIVRKTYESTNYSKPEELESSGFCSWEELKIIDSENVLDVQSHAKTHTWYPISDKIIDFRNPKDDYIWMDWNQTPEEKPFLQLLSKKESELGKAIFEHEKALSSKCIKINPDFQQALNTYVVENGGRAFFDKDNWKDLLHKKSEELKNNYKVVLSKESDEEYHERIRYELEYTKNEISSKLDKEVNFLCWPGGSSTKVGLKISKELGYLMSTAARDLTSAERKSIKNIPNQKINRISRFAPVVFYRFNKQKQKHDIIYSNGAFFLLQVKSFQGSFLSKVIATVINKLLSKIK